MSLHESDLSHVSSLHCQKYVILKYFDRVVIIEKKVRRYVESSKVDVGKKEFIVTDRS